MANEQKVLGDWEANRIQPVGYCDMDGRPAFKMSIREHNGRWYLFTGHFWHSGWSIVDVTDPASPRPVRFLQGPENTWTLQMELSGNTMITSLEQIFPNFGGDRKKPFDEGVLIWDISDPERPERLGQFRTGGTGTHRNFYSGGRYMHLSAGMPGYHGNIYVIVDISDPAKPVEAGRWWVPGQYSGGDEKPRPAPQAHYNASAARDHSLCFCDSAGEDISLHGPPYVVGNLAYLPYGGAGMVVLDISDVSKPVQVGHLPFSPPFHSKFGVHGVLPVPERNIAFANSEDTSYGIGPAHHASIIDISDPRKLFLLSVFPEPVPSSGAPYRDFSTWGGWCGPHNINHLQHNPDVEKQGDLFYIAHFNAGLRIYDVGDFRLPREVGYFLPPEPVRRYGPLPEGRLVLQTEDVLVDRRGFIYITDKNQGLWILRQQYQK
jgi:hypothetical protein